MAPSEQLVQSTLSRAGAKYSESAKTDVMAALRSFPQLLPEIDTFEFPDGRRRAAFRLKGTIPVVIKGQTYNIPVSVYLWETHPYYAPICYVNPTPSMVIKESETVDKKGKIYLPYLSEWRYPGYDLNGLLQVMAMVFQERCPLYVRQSSSSSSTPARATPPVPAQPSSTPYPTPQPSYPSPTPYPTSAANAMPTPYPINVPQPPYPTSNPYPSQPTPYPPYPSRDMTTSTPAMSSASNTIQPEHIRLSLLSAVEDRIRQRLRDTLGTKHAEIASIRQTQNDLRDGQVKLKRMTEEMERQQKELETFTFTYQDKKKELTRALEESGNAEDRQDLDAAIEPTTPLYKQLLDCYAQDLACDDTIYALGQALKNGSLSAAEYMKHVRNVSRRQFVARATMHKCRGAAGLSV